MKEKNTTLEIILQALDDKESFLDVSSTDFSKRLKQRGFSEEHIEIASTWVMQLMQQQALFANVPPIPRGLRIFTREETEKLDLECRNFILGLEYEQILEPKTREILINQLLLLNHNIITVYDIKLVTLMILLLQPNSDEKTQKIERFALKSGINLCKLS